MIKHKDRFVTKNDVTQQNHSVLSGKTVTELKFLTVQRIPAAQLAPSGKVEAMPAKMSPMLAEAGDAPFHRAEWMWEPKLDGYRVLVFIDERGVTLRSRRGLDLSAKFPRLVTELAQQSVNGMILDGEIVAFDANGKPSFAALQDRAGLKMEREIAAADKTLPVVFYCFDLPFFAGVDLRKSPYSDRRRYLSQCLLPSPLVQRVHAHEDGVALSTAALASGFEGVVGKRKQGRYEDGRRSPSWLKVKPTRTADFIIGGYTRGKGSRAPLGAILVGYWEVSQMSNQPKAKLQYASHVGSGFDERALKQVKDRLEPLQRKSSPFEEIPELNGPTTWVEPQTVAEVSFQNWTEDGHLRAPIFLRLRDDIDPLSVRRADPDSATADSSGGPTDDVVRQLASTKAAFTLAVGMHRIRLTRLDRVYWPADPAQNLPAFTKRDLLTYLAQVSPYMLPHLADRPLTMIRMPDGIDGQRFFQKHWEQERPDFVESITVFSSSKEEQHDYLLCNNLPTLLWLAQSGTLEFHVWHSRARSGADATSKSTDYASSLEALEASVLNYPDYVLFDLDPYIYSGKEAKGAEPDLNKVAFEKGKEVAFWLRELLLSMSLEAIVKTSGKTGLHVFVPIRRTIDFDAARHVSELVGRHLQRAHPKDITLEWSIPKRTGKIFMDYNMNVRGKTLNVAYSPRGVPGAPVSMPLTWDELAGAHPLDFTLANAPERLAQTGDRWRDALQKKQDLEAALSKTSK
jgi:bifunctional non-homologous end joining protein LigD